MLETILENYPDEIFIKADGLDEAIIGIEYNTMCLIYSTSKCVEIMNKTMKAEEVEEWLEHNTFGAGGEGLLIYCEDRF